MSLQSIHELGNTRRKLRDLEQEYDRAIAGNIENRHVHEATLRSLRSLINQLKEEIARFESRQPVHR